MADGHYGPVAANLPKDQLGVSSAGTEKWGWGTVTAARATGVSAKSVHEERCSYFCFYFFYFFIVALKVLL